MAGGEKKFYQQKTLPSLVDEGPVEIPEKIGPYRVETLLAKGGMSLLYLGFDPQTKEPRVIKVLSPAYLNHPEMIDHFLWEAKIIGMADHPNIVKLYEYGKWEGGLYIAMEFIRGVSLSQFLMQQSFSLKRCLSILLQVAYALSHLHTHGVIHRDLKPENILISQDGEVKVIDFGIAQLHEDNGPKSTRQVMGTPNYMAPEQKEHAANATFVSDIYSLGVISYELILGKLSYGVISLALLPPGMQKIIGKAIAISPKERYQDIVDFITDLTAYAKSPELNKERPTTDQVIELMEIVQRGEQALSTFERPTWPQFDIGIAKERTPEQVGLYIDFFKFSNNTEAVILAHTTSSRISSSIHIAVLRGMIKSLINPYLTSNIAFDPTEFATTLNTLIYQDKLQESFSLSILKLIPYNDTLSLLCCGPSVPLLHVPQGSNSPRTIHSENRLIGENMNASFAETVDTFNDGDLLLLTNLPKEPFEKPLLHTLSKNVLLSPHRLCDVTLEAAAAQESYAHLRHPKVVVTLQRIS
ncbi:MAG: protein kinase [Verrucomicrobia bacterium]|nr:protein kinase [Verrucomicrobiota bacterium]